MTRVVIHRVQARRETTQMAFQFTRRVLHEIRFRARANLLSGPYTTGRLARSLEIKGPYVHPGRVTGSVGTDLHYAEAVEKGAGLWGPRRSKYLIYPRRARNLRFYWRRVGRVVTLPYVRHPGQRGKGYLEKAAEEIGRRHNMIVIIYDV
jgi:hypothetical protein